MLDIVVRYTEQPRDQDDEALGGTTIYWLELHGEQITGSDVSVRWPRIRRASAGSAYSEVAQVNWAALGNVPADLAYAFGTMLQRAALDAVERQARFDATPYPGKATS